MLVRLYLIVLQYFALETICSVSSLFLEIISCILPQLTSKFTLTCRIDLTVSSEKLFLFFGPLFLNKGEYTLHKCIAKMYGENNTYQLVEKRKIVIPGKDIYPLLLSFFFLENIK